MVTYQQMTINEYQSTGTYQHLRLTVTTNGVPINAQQTEYNLDEAQQPVPNSEVFIKIQSLFFWILWSCKCIL